MKVYLTSNGKIGFSSVEFRQPTMRDIKGIDDLPEQNFLKKTAFVKALLEDPRQIDSLTLDDRDFLFVLAVASLNFNKFDFSTECTCGNTIDDSILLDDTHPVFLSTELEATKVVNGQKFRFRKLRVADENEAIDYAFIKDEDFDSRFEDAFTCRALDLPITDESIEYVRNLDISIYYLAQYFQLCCPHGMNLSKEIQCQCGKTITAIIPINGDLLKINNAVLMDRFIGISGVADYRSFLEMTLPEYNALVEAINGKHTG